MTIYKPRNGREKTSGKQAEKPPVGGINDDLVLPLTQPLSSKGDGSQNVFTITRRNPRYAERTFAKVCTAASIITIFIFAACLGYFVHQRVFGSKPIIHTIQVEFQDYRRHVETEDETLDNHVNGAFYQQSEIDWKMERYEKLSIPPFIDSKRSIVIHDFKYNLTAIVDHDQSRCFVLPLNRTVTYPPRRFMECVRTVKSGFSLPLAKVERQMHKVITPPDDKFSSYGKIIATDCRYYHTHKLVKSEVANEPNKRFACQFSGRTYSLGETGYPLMVLISLDGCI